MMMNIMRKVFQPELWHWSTLRAIGNSPAVKMTIFIPLIGYMVIFNENILRYVQLSEYIFGNDVATGAGAHVSLRLIVIYFGLSFLAVGSIIYQLFCPVEVKRFKTSIDYIAAARSNIGEFALRRIEDRLTRQLGEPNESFGEFAAVRDFAEGRNAEWGEIDARERALVKGEVTVLDANFRKLNESSFSARLATFVFYIIGFILLSVPAIGVFCRVARVAFNDLF